MTKLAAVTNYEIIENGFITIADKRSLEVGGEALNTPIILVHEAYNNYSELLTNSIEYYRSGIWSPVSDLHGEQKTKEYRIDLQLTVFTKSRSPDDPVCPKK